MGTIIDLNRDFLNKFHYEISILNFLIYAVFSYDFSSVHFSVLLCVEIYIYKTYGNNFLATYTEGSIDVSFFLFFISKFNSIREFKG